MVKYEYHLVLVWQMVTMIIVLSWNLNVLAAISVAKAGCQQKCGGINIPYPFGMGNKSCYFDEWFEVECVITSTSTQPFLKKVDLELLEIRLPSATDTTGWIYANNPVLVSSPNCSTSNNNSTGTVTRAAIDFTGSTFYFSQSWNTFGTAGCNNQVWMTGSKGPELVGCTSSCSNTTGIGSCCQTTIPSSLKLFNVTFGGTDAGQDGSSGCKYAFLAQYKWFRAYPTSSCLSAIVDLESVPVWVEWGLYNSTAEALALGEQSIVKNSSFGCTDYSYNDGSVIQFCYCNTGFEGNPYLLNGCQDIDECKDPQLTNCNTTCINTYGSYNCSDNSKSQSVVRIIFLVLGSVLGLLMLSVALWWGSKFMERRKEIKLKKKFFTKNGGLLLEQQLLSNQGNAEKTTIFKSKELELATDNFNSNRILGGGGQGTIYKGMLRDGRIVAIKKSRIEAEEEVATFINEVVILSQTLHRNIVKMLGCCLETEVPLLVYEFVPNGDLSYHLHNDKESSLPWDKRLRIASETAGALFYLHSLASIPIYHRDIKSANILLDHKYTAKIADFGISKSIGINQTHITTRVIGTYGYLDPEYFESGQYTDKSDVYSFGIMLVELLTGQKATNLAPLFIKSMEDNRLYGIVDARVRQQGGKDEIEAVANVARKCLNKIGKQRPTMREVASDLEKIRALHKTVNADETESEYEYQATENVGVQDYEAIFEGGRGTRGHETWPLRGQQYEEMELVRGHQTCA